MEASGNSQANNVVELPRRAGRPKGSKNRRTIAVEDAMRPLLPKARKALLRLLTADGVDDEVRLKAAALVHAYKFGKPRERQEISGPDGAPISQRVDDGGPSAEEVARCAVGILERAKAGTP